MASCSSPRHVKYDAFLSFRGEDTRDNFTSHLHASLCRRKIRTFIDNELRRGDEISPSLLNVIERSKISIIIFSKGYAFSRWCLEELVKILECKRIYGQIVIPIFYHIKPSELRKQGGTFGDEFVEHEGRLGEKQEMLQRWRNALTEAANISGFDSTTNRPESKLIEKIVEDVLKRLNDMSTSDNKNLVGLGMKIQKIKALLCNESNEVCKIGLWGMGGIGKTTIANAVFNEISSQFEASYFIQNVREESEKRGLYQLQKDLLSTILEDGHLNVRLTFTRERLRRKKVLIVFDDVTHLNQINELIGSLENLGSRSRIIITTRDKQVLKNCGLDDDTIYEVKELQAGEAFQLFKQHAFKQNHLIDEDYIKLSSRVISYTKGLPLALKVLGSFLLDRGKHEWESALDKLERSPHRDIQMVLKISYDGLDDEEKSIFLDIACFFKGWDEYLVKKIFYENCSSTNITISVLIDKALITTSNNTITMHDLLQEMGREIVRQESSNKPSQRSRLWDNNDVHYVFKRNLGTDIIRGLCFDTSEMREIHLNPYAFSEMSNLRYIVVHNSKHRENNIKLHGFEGLECDFIELRCFCWDDYPYKSLPSKFYPENLFVLKMQHANLEQLWAGIKNFANLKYIDLSNSKHLLKVHLLEAPNIESLILEDCINLSEITPPSQNLNKLINLNLRNCRSLISIPIGIQSKSLRDVILSGCSNLNEAPSISCDMERLCLDGTAIKELSSSIECPSKLVELNLKDCSNLQSLPGSICNLKSLRHLKLSGLSNLNVVPEIPCKLEELYLDGTAIKELPSSIEDASNLIKLDLRNCSSLESLSNDICKLKSLRCLYISGCSKLCRLPEEIGNLESLEVLEANGVTIRELPSSMVLLKNLHDLSFERWKSQKLLSSLSPILSGLQFLRRLNLNHCSLTELPSNLDQLHLLRDLELEGNNFESVPTNIMNLSELRLLNLRFCDRLRSLPRLPRNIQDLKADGCKLLKTLSGLTIPSQGYYKRTLSFINCFNLDWNVLRNILNDSVLKMYSDRTLWLDFTEGVGSREGCMCFPGSEIPEWFDIQSNGSSIELPKGSFNHKFLGCAFCTIVGFPDYHRFFNDIVIRYELRLKWEDGHKTVAKTKFSVLKPKYIESDHVFVGYNCSTSEFHEFPCNAEAIIIFNSPNSVIKKCGVHLLFTQQTEEPMKRSRCTIFDEDEAHSKRLKSSDFFEGESSSSLDLKRPELHLVRHETEVVEEFDPSTNEPTSFTLLDLEEFSQVSIGTTMGTNVTATLGTTDYDEAESSTGSGCYYDEDEVMNS